MGHASKSQYIDIQNPKKSPFNNMDFGVEKRCLTWRAHIIEIEYAYIPHARVSKFSEQ
jgi:hypothetical protein